MNAYQLLNESLLVIDGFLMIPRYVVSSTTPSSLYVPPRPWQWQCIPRPALGFPKLPTSSTDRGETDAADSVDHNEACEAKAKLDFTKGLIFGFPPTPPF
jgi:hypothetical protein